MLKLWDVIKLNSFNDILKILTPFYINHKFSMDFANFVGARSGSRRGEDDVVTMRPHPQFFL